MKALMRSFGFAARGIRLAVVTQRNVRIHLLATVFVLCCAFLARVEPWAWAALTLSCALVLFAELINTALEVLCDRVEPDRNPLIRDCKDIAAGAVFLCALLSVVVAGTVFLRPSALAALLSRPVPLGVLVVLTALLLPALCRTSAK